MSFNIFCQNIEANKALCFRIFGEHPLMASAMKMPGEDIGDIRGQCRFVEGRFSKIILLFLLANMLILHCSNLQHVCKIFVQIINALFIFIRQNV